MTICNAGAFCLADWGMLKITPLMRRSQIVKVGMSYDEFRGKYPGNDGLEEFYYTRLINYFEDCEAIEMNIQISSKTEIAGCGPRTLAVIQRELTFPNPKHAENKKTRLLQSCHGTYDQMLRSDPWRNSFSTGVFWPGEPDRPGKPYGKKVIKGRVFWVVQ
jgi:hypothetical protein